MVVVSPSVKSTVVEEVLWSLNNTVVNVCIRAGYLHYIRHFLDFDALSECKTVWPWFPHVVKCASVAYFPRNQRDLRDKVTQLDSHSTSVDSFCF